MSISSDLASRLHCVMSHMFCDLAIAILLSCLVPSSQGVRGCIVMLKSDTSNFKISICNNPKAHLTSIPADFPVNLIRLGMLHQNITTLPPKAFRHIYQLEYLSIISCGLREISNAAFEGLSVLQKLVLSNNSLVVHEKFNLLADVFQPLSSLTFLDLSHNFIQSITSNFFHHIHDSLKVLIITNSKSSMRITPASFDSLMRLEKLDISSNNLIQLDPGFENVFNKMASLQSLNLQGNPWKCDCRMKWLAFWFQHSTVSPYQSDPISTMYSNTKCHSPRSMRNIPLFRPFAKQILKDEFPCIPRCLTKDANVDATEGDTVSVPCLFAATGEDFDIVWSFFGGNISQYEGVYFELKKTNLLRSVLTIRNISYSHAGVWRCFIIYDGLSIGANISILVKSDDFLDRHFVKKSLPDLSSVKLVVFIFLGAIVSVFVVAIFSGFICRNVRRSRLLRRRRNKKRSVANNVDLDSVFYNRLQDGMKWNIDCQEMWSLQHSDGERNVLGSPSLNYLIPRSSPLTDKRDSNSHIFINPYAQSPVTLITRTPGSTPCPVHEESPFKRLRNETQQQQTTPSPIYQPCPLHGDVLAVLMQSSVASSNS